MNEVDAQQLQQEGLFEQFLIQHENETFYNLTNGRKIGGTEVGEHQQKVLAGRNKILNFIHRGVQIQVKKIKDSKHS
jgi:hypothetical protein